jgi:hypothetical protein
MADLITEAGPGKGGETNLWGNQSENAGLQTALYDCKMNIIGLWGNNQPESGGYLDGQPNTLNKDMAQL